MPQDSDFSFVAGRQATTLGIEGFLVLPGGMNVLLFHLNLSLLKLVDLRSDHFHFLKLSRHWGACQSTNVFSPPTHDVIDGAENTEAITLRIPWGGGGL